MTNSFQHLKEPLSISKYQEVPPKYPVVPKRTKKYLEVPQSKQKYLKNL